MLRITLETPTHFHLLRSGDEVEFVDEDTIEVTAPDGLEGGRMALSAWQVRDLISCEDTEGLAEVGIEVIASVSRVHLN
jgi:hypothetical protein